jgi:hypothetical protein
LDANNWKAWLVDLSEIGYEGFSKEIKTETISLDTTTTFAKRAGRIFPDRVITDSQEMIKTQKLAVVLKHQINQTGESSFVFVTAYPCEELALVRSPFDATIDTSEKLKESLQRACKNALVVDSSLDIYESTWRKELKIHPLVIEGLNLESL